MGSESKPRSRVTLWQIMAIGLIAIGLIGGGLAWVGLGNWAGKPDYRLRITGGSVEGRRHRLAEALAREAKRQGIRLQVLPTAGSEQAMDRIESGSLDLALVQGGLDPGKRVHVREVAPLHIEPLHLLVKEELVEAVRTHLANLQGKVIDVGVPGSGTRVLARRVLEQLRINYRPAELGQAELLEATDRDTMPDAVFLISTLPSKVVQHLIARRGYRLVSVPFHEALLLDLRAQNEDAATNDRPATIYAYDAQIPAFTYGDPPEPVRTIGTRLLLVARDTTDPAAVERLLDTIYSVPYVHVSYPPLDRKLLQEPPEIPWHEGTLQHLQRRPLSDEQAIELVNNQLGIVGAVLGGGFFLWQWLKRRWRRVRERGFEHYILRVARVERRSLDLELASTLDLKGLLQLREELSRLKDEALEKFAAGDIEGEELMTAFLSHVGDTRDHLARLILHQRDNLEQQAHSESRPLESVWKETVGHDRSATPPIGPTATVGVTHDQPTPESRSHSA